jgi:ubiquinone/menaquinone biosynthesis C-methylase UbiE
MMQNDPRFVDRQYATAERLQTRRAVWGPDESGLTPQDVAVRAVAEIRPDRALEVGCGTGELAERMSRESGAEVVALDRSPAMVEQTAARGVLAMLGHVQQLPFPSASFDCAVAAWMLYHVADLHRGLAELARVLRPSGRLVAVTNSSHGLSELYELCGMPRRATTFSRENGREALERHFRQVRQTDLRTRAIFPDRAAAVRYLETLERGDAAVALPQFDGPLAAHGLPTVFVADGPVTAEPLP